MASHWSANRSSRYRSPPAWRQRMTRVCSAHTAAGTIWEVDAAPGRGKAGQLVRHCPAIGSTTKVGRRPGEFQAMLKARPAAGDPGTGASLPLILWRRWSRRAAEREAASVADTRQAMRKRVVAHIPSRDRGRELKLGRAVCATSSSLSSCCSWCMAVDERLRLRATLPVAEDLDRLTATGRRRRQGIRSGLSIPANARAPHPALQSPAHSSAPKQLIMICVAWGARSATEGSGRESSSAPGVTPPSGYAGCTSGSSTPRCSTRSPRSRRTNSGRPPTQPSTG